MQNTGSGNGKAPIIEEFILESLAFKSMTDRQDEVASAHKQTFEWIFNSQASTSVKTSASISNFPAWLRSNDEGGIYWINGKAGSGKSTLMRFICDHTETAEQLHLWAADTPLAVAGFFFWTSGSKEQRSPAGFLRSILFQLLPRHLELMPDVFPEIWARYMKFTTMERIKTPIVWTVEALKEGLLRFLRAAEGRSRVCLFIDGLDEFEGDHSSIIGFLRSAVDAARQHVKICLSSRPWTVFEEAFEQVPTLRLQDLTWGDMEKYVSDELTADVRVRRVLKNEPDKGAELMQEIVRKADGVFLWVLLAVRSLLKDFCSGDGVASFHERLSVLPTELDDLFQHMLFNRLSKSDLQAASQIFQLIYAQEVVGDLTGNQTSTALTLWKFSLATEKDPDLVFRIPIQKASTQEILKRCEDMKEYINTQCAGLLEVHSKRASSDIDGLRFQEENATDVLALAASKVSYLHRTVRDFLLTPTVWNSILQQTIESEIVFSPHLAHLRAYTLQLKIPLEKPKKDRHHFEDWWPDIMLSLTHARMAEGVSPTLPALLDELDKTLSWYWIPKRTVPQDHWARRAFGTYEERNKAVINEPFLALVTRLGILSYVERALDTKRADYKDGRPLLSYAVEFLVSRRQSVYPLSSVSLVGMLLERGADPNLVYADFLNKGGKETPWLACLKLVREARRRGWIEEEGLRRWVAILRLFLERGAEPNAIILANRWDPEICALGVVEEVLATTPAPDIRELRDALVEAGARSEVEPQDV